jgi:beta-lactam-binding protein with PASTA domain
VDTFSGLPSGTMLDGRYRLGGLIARGGMSTVYRGLDTRLDRPVAIKVMSPYYVTDPAFLSRFEREARLAAGLGHPGVVAVYDYGRDGDLVFLVMELVDGGTLRDLLRERGSLSVPVTMSILEPLLAALGAAHAAGLVHRDVKPENVLISSKGAVKIADFGLVRAVTSQTMATGDVILGTVAYLSPEQVSTGAADPRSDVYAAGIVAYEMLTGRPPYGGDNPMSVAYQHVHNDVPRPSDSAPGTPEGLDNLVSAATRRDPLSRPRDASAFLSALVGIRARMGLRRVPVPVPHRRPHPAGPPMPPAHPMQTAHPVHPADDGTRGYPLPAAVGAEAVGPRGTRMLAAGGPVTAAQPPATATPAAAVPPVTAAPTDGAGQQAPAAQQSGPVLDQDARTHAAALRRRRRTRWLIAILIVVLLAVSAAAGGWWLAGRWSATPALVGMTQSAAEAATRDAGLVPQVRTEHDDRVPTGQVAGTDPAAGTRQLRGSTVDVLVSIGHPAVPSIAPGTGPETAEAALTAADLTPVRGSKPVYDDTVPLGAVIRIEPAAGTSLTVGSPVTLVLSAGPAPVEVPDVAGKPTQDAETRLVADGFAVGPRGEAFDPNADAGVVLGTDPAAGVDAPRGSAVSLRVSNALTVPDVRGKATDEARKSLQEAGFTVTVGDPAFDADIDAGDILRTDPGPGARVDPADARIFLVPSNSVPVPDLTNGTVRQAAQELDSLGLKLSVTAVFGGEDASVWNQSPGAGGRIEPGGTVSVTAFP